MDDLLENIENLAKQIQKNPTQRQLQEAQELLDLARQDLQSSRLNHSDRLFNIASYHMQQSVEKAAKSFYKILGVLDDNTIRKTSHDTPELFLRMVELPWAQDFGKFVKEVSGTEMTLDTSEGQSVVDSKTRRAEMARLDRTQIENWLRIIPQIEKGLLPLANLINNHYVLPCLRLYILSSLTFPHENVTRYVDEMVKPAEYTPNLGIVAAMAAIWAETEKAIVEVQYLIDVSNKKSNG